MKEVEYPLGQTCAGGYLGFETWGVSVVEGGSL